MATQKPKKNNADSGFLQVDNKILELLLCGTKLNVYGVLILCKVREFQRKKVPCFMSNETFAVLFDASLHTIKTQINVLLDLGLLEKTVELNVDGKKGKKRTLHTHTNYTKNLEKILKNKFSKGQISTDEIQPMKTDLQGVFDDFIGRPSTDENDPMKPNFNYTISSDENDAFIGRISTVEKRPVLRENNNTDINNKLLEDNSMSSPASSIDDLWNDNGDENAIIPAVINDANFDSFFSNNFGDNLDGNLNINNINEEQISDMKNLNKPRREPNQKYDEMTVWYLTQLNPISRYNYEIKYKSAAKNFAWGERERKDNQKDYYTVDQIIEYFSKENRLDYLKEIHYTDYLKEINYPHMWMFEM